MWRYIKIYLKTIKTVYLEKRVQIYFGVMVPILVIAYTTIFHHFSMLSVSLTNRLK